ncbi:hypothetical protein AAEP80_04090 [Curtobacterium sp. L3-7]|uniref:hypothetical protein n=1 Tax=Curtobacterium sp. L3-7 TaxID=3138787 RepID=UPI003B518D73
MQDTLVRAGAFLTIYELVTTSIVEIVASSHERGWAESGPIYTPEYQQRFLRRGQNRVKESISWLIDEDVLEDSDQETMAEVREYRNSLAHELAKALIDPDAPAKQNLIVCLYELMRKVERFQASLHLDANAEFDNREVDPDDVHTGVRIVSDLVMQLIMPAPGAHLFALDDRTRRQSIVVTSEERPAVYATPDALETAVAELPEIPHAPAGVASLLQLSRRLLVMSSVEYEFAALGAEKALQAVETTLRHVFNANPRQPYSKLINRYLATHPDGPLDAEMLNSGRRLRNVAAHPKNAAAMPIVLMMQSVRTSHQIVEELLRNRTER